MSEEKCRIKQSNQFWIHYLSLENSLQNISDYIAIHENNYKSYSFKNMQLFFAVCTDIDSIFKHIRANVENIQISQPTIKQHKLMIVDHFPIISKTKVYINISGNKLVFQPFEELNVGNEKLEWWSAYNEVKHQRPENFYKANIKNLLNGFAALHILNVIYAISLDECIISRYDSVLVEVSALRNYPLFQIESSGIVRYTGGSDYYACRLNNESIYPL